MQVGHRAQPAATTTGRRWAAFVLSFADALQNRFSPWNFSARHKLALPFRRVSRVTSRLNLPLSVVGSQRNLGLFANPTQTVISVRTSASSFANESSSRPSIKPYPHNVRLRPAVKPALGTDSPWTQCPIVSTASAAAACGDMSTSDNTAVCSRRASVLHCLHNSLGSEAASN